MMNRRELLLIAAKTSALGLACGPSACRTARVIGPWDGPVEVSDPRLRVASYGLLAPSSHNTQPWSIAIAGDRAFDLYVDPRRLLPEVDPDRRQTWISHGAFLECARQGALREGYRTTVELLPKGPGDPLPTARISVSSGADAGPLSGAVLSRTSNKRRYRPDQLVSAPDRAALLEAGQGHARVALFDGDALSRIRELCIEAMRIEVSNPVRNAETLDWFRLGPDEIERSSDGFGLAQAGTMGLKRWFAESFVLSNRTRMAEPDSAFARGSVDQVRGQVDSASLFAAIITPANDREHQLWSGQAYARAQLVATARGLASHPLSQALQEYADMREVRDEMHRALGAADNETVQMLFRIGHADPVPHAPRRDVHDLLRSGTPA